MRPPRTGSARKGGVPHLDCYDLALGAIDYVVDKMGFDTGADPEQVVTHIFDEICDWVPGADTDEAEAAARAMDRWGVHMDDRDRQHYCSCSRGRG